MGRVSISENLETTPFNKGVIVPTLTPFDEHGMVMMRAITDQARRLSLIDGVFGIAVNTTFRERQSMRQPERLDVLRRTRDGLAPSQLLLACVGELSGDVEDEVEACFRAGADAVISFSNHWQDGLEYHAFKSHLAKLAKLSEQSPLPIIVILGKGQTRWGDAPEGTMLLASAGRQILGFDMGLDYQVLHYAQDFHTRKSVTCPWAVLPSSEGAPFHNLKTSIDNVLSSLAYIAPYEMATLYSASRDGQIHGVQAIHDRLAPMVKLLDGHDAKIREMIYREIAHARCLLASPTARGLTKSLCPHLTASLHTTLDDIALEPISWV